MAGRTQYKSGWKRNPAPTDTPHPRFKQLVEIEEAVEFYKLSAAQLREAIVDGALAPWNLNGRTVFEMGEIIRYGTLHRPRKLEFVESPSAAADKKG